LYFSGVTAIYAVKNQGASHVRLAVQIVAQDFRTNGNPVFLLSPVYLAEARRREFFFGNR
jgi:hypothetical protein